MRKVLAIAFIIFGFASQAFATDVSCPLHPYASCYNTHQLSSTGTAQKWHCSCGDDVWVAWRLGDPL
jgi:hypothetical protein